MMIRTFFSLAVTVCMALALPGGSAAAAERIAVLMSMDEAPFLEAFAGFRDYLEKQGVQPGYEVFNLESSASKAGPAVRKIKAGGFTLIYTLGALAADAAVKDITDIPIVAGLVLRTDALKKAPNATGVGLEFPLETQFAWLHRILPEARTVGVIYSARENRKKVETAARIAQTLGLSLEQQEVSMPQDVPAALNRLSQKADVLWGVADTLVLSPQLAKPILLFSFRNSIPFVGPSATWVKAGALYSLDYDYREIGAQCAEIARQILQGVPPGEIPPQSPRSVKYSLNMNTARAMKITLSDEVLRGALHTY
jgi:putative tryptophan/tyrosine transport system substrate-binding protein